MCVCVCMYVYVLCPIEPTSSRSQETHCMHNGGIHSFPLPCVCIYWTHANTQQKLHITHLCTETEQQNTALIRTPKQMNSSAALAYAQKQSTTTNNNTALTCTLKHMNSNRAHAIHRNRATTTTRQDSLVYRNRARARIHKIRKHQNRTLLRRNFRGKRQHIHRSAPACRKQLKRLKPGSERLNSVGHSGRPE